MLKCCRLLKLYINAHFSWVLIFIPLVTGALLDSHILSRDARDTEMINASLADLNTDLSVDHEDPLLPPSISNPPSWTVDNKTFLSNSEVFHNESVSGEGKELLTMQHPETTESHHLFKGTNEFQNLGLNSTQVDGELSEGNPSFEAEIPTSKAINLFGLTDKPASGLQEDGKYGTLNLLITIIQLYFLHFRNNCLIRLYLML